MMRWRQQEKKKENAKKTKRGKGETYKKKEKKVNHDKYRKKGREDGR